MGERRLHFEQSPNSEKSPNGQNEEDKSLAEEELLISDIQPAGESQLQGHDGASDVDGLLKTGAFTKELMMSSTLRSGLGSTLKEANKEIQQE